MAAAPEQQVVQALLVLLELLELQVVQVLLVLLEPLELQAVQVLLVQLVELEYLDSLGLDFVYCHSFIHTSYSIV